MLASLDPLDTAGFVVLGSALDDAWVERLRLAFAAAPPQQDGTQHVRIDESTPELSAWRALDTHPAVPLAAARVLGRAYRIRDAHGRNPLRGYGQQGLHADWPPRSGDDTPMALTAIWMLDDFTPSNGATRVVPGTHRLRTAIPKSLAQPLAHHPDEVLITGRAGSVLLFNGHLWHSGTRNHSGASRRAVQMTIEAANAQSVPSSSSGAVPSTGSAR